MRPGPLFFLFAVSLLPLHLHAEESPAQPAAVATSAAAQIADLTRRLEASEQQREALSAELKTGGDRESPQLQRLRQENQRLKLQLKKAQAEAPEHLLSDQQMWFAIGAGAALLGVILGALLRGNRRTRREWIN